MTDTAAAIEAAVQAVDEAYQIEVMDGEPCLDEVRAILTRLVDTVTAGERERLTNAAVRWWLANTPAALSQHEINGHEQDLRRALSSSPSSDFPSGEWGKRVLADLLAEIKRMTPAEYSQLYDNLPRPPVEVHDIKEFYEDDTPSPPSSGRETGIHRLAIESQDMEPQIVDAVNDHFWELLNANPDVAAPSIGREEEDLLTDQCPGDPKCEILRKITSQTGRLLSRKEALEISQSTLESAEKERHEQDAPSPAAAEAGEHCQRCGRTYNLTVWRAPDELWQAVTGRADGGGLYCPTCFTATAAERGISVYWDACRAEAWDKPAAAAPMLAPSSPARRRSEMSHYHGLCMKCGRPLAHTGETTLCSQCMGGTMVVGHGAVYPADTTKMSEPVIINRADFGEMLEAKQQARELGRQEGREAGIRECLEAADNEMFNESVDADDFARGYNKGIEDTKDALCRLLPGGGKEDTNV